LKSELKRIYLSIYCDKPHWKGLIGVLSDLENQLKLVEPCIQIVLHFGREINPYLGITLLLPSKYARNVTYLVDDYIKKYLGKTRIPVKGQKDTLFDKLFMDIPSGTLHYNFHNFPASYFVDLSEETIARLSDKISNAIIHSFKEDSYDEEMVFTLSFYLQALLLLAFFENLENCCAEIATISKDFKVEPSSVVYEELFLANPSYFEDILEDVFVKKIWIDGGEPWMNEWWSLCNEIRKALDKDEFSSGLKSMSSLIDKQLGLKINFYKVWFKIIPLIYEKKKPEEYSGDH
jgi:hypothetical protein